MLFESGLLNKNIPWFEILANGFFSGLFTTLSVMPWLLLLGILAGWFSAALSKSSLIKPNQGIRNSARYSLLVGSLSGVIIGLASTGLQIVIITMVFLPFFKLIFEFIKLDFEFIKTIQANTPTYVPNYQATLTQYRGHFPTLQKEVN